MISFFTTLFASKLAQKIGIYIAIGLLLGWGLRIHDNRIFNQGRQEGTQVAVKEALAAAEVNWKAQLDGLQKQIDEFHVVAAHAGAAAHTANTELQAAITKAADTRTAITQQVAQTPIKQLSPAIVANDATIKPEDTVSLKTHLLEAQLNVQQLDDEVKEILKDHKAYVEQIDIQIGALKDEIQATRGELVVMTAERNQYKDALNTATKKRGCGLFKKIVSLGLCR